MSVLYLAAFKKFILETVKDMITVLSQIDRDFFLSTMALKSEKWPNVI
jgi:hypothetical protein